MTLEEIRKRLISDGITGYRIGKDTPINQVTADNFLNGKSKPYKSTLEIYESYIKNGYQPLEQKQIIPISEKVSEPNVVYNDQSAIWVNYESFMLVPLVNHRAQAGFLSGWGDDEYLEELPKIPFEVDKEYKGRYMCFEVAGESMESEDEPRDSLYEGDILLCREIHQQHWRNKLHINKWDFVVVHREQGILAKRIINHDTTNGTITLHSLNPYYEDQVVRLDDLIALFNIIDVKRSRKRR